jgi:glycerol uptake facilitator-like aquaporin
VVIFGVLASSRYHRWAPLAAGVVLGAIIVTVAPLGGAGFSPVRGLAPDVLVGTYPTLWIYFAGPLRAAPRRRPPS